MCVTPICGSRRGVSPVIATVILVAVAITVAVAVSYWMAGISSQYTSFEKVEITGAYSTYDESATEWTITMELKNSGSAEATLVSIFVNDKPMEKYLDAAGLVRLITCDKIDPDTATQLSISSGEPASIQIIIDDHVDITFTSGTTLNIKIHSADGKDYIRLVKL